jgi:hypothetical protein
MRTGRAGTFLAIAVLLALGGCASNEPRAILSAGELESMIRVEVELIEPERSDDNVVAALQP